MNHHHHRGGRGPRHWGCGPGSRRASGNGNGKVHPNRLYRNPADGYVFGVAAGIADYFGIDGWIVRALLIVGVFVAGPPLIIGYVILALVLSRKPETLYKDESEEKFWRDVRVDPQRSFSALRHRFRELEQRLRSMEAFVTSDAYRVHREINDLDR